MYYLTLLILSGCVSAPTEHLFVNSTLTEVADVSARLAPLYAVNPRPVHIYWHDRLENGELAVACVSCSPCEVALSRETPLPLLEVVLWHEYGHCVGFQHEEAGVMKAVAEPVSEEQKALFLSRVKWNRGN